MISNGSKKNSPLNQWFVIKMNRFVRQPGPAGLKLKLNGSKDRLKLAIS
jgi:hypothetical protein